MTEKRERSRLGIPDEDDSIDSFDGFEVVSSSSEGSGDDRKPSLNEPTQTQKQKQKQKQKEQQPMYPTLSAERLRELEVSVVAARQRQRQRQTPSPDVNSTAGQRGEASVEKRPVDGAETEIGIEMGKKMGMGTGVGAGFVRERPLSLSSLTGPSYADAPKADFARGSYTDIGRKGYSIGNRIGGREENSGDDDGGRRSERDKTETELEPTVPGQESYWGLVKFDR